MDAKALEWVDDFIRRVREYRVSAEIGPATGWDPNAVEIEPWHEKYRRIHVPSFFRDYTVDRDELIAAMEGDAVNEATARRASRELVQQQFRAWLQCEDVDSRDLDAMAEAYDINPLS